MRHALILKKKLEYARFLHLLFMYLAAMLIFLWANLPHGWWVLAMTLGISSSIEPGLMVGHSINRSKGSFIALLLLPSVLYFLQVNYRFVPVVFILSVVGFNVCSLNPKRFDLAVFLNTFAMILLLAQTTYFTSQEGPIEAVINRSLSTVIAVMIVIAGDYFLFKSYGYSQKLYLFHQCLVYDLVRNVVCKVETASEDGSNTFIVLNQMRWKANEVFSLIAESAANLKTDLKVSPAMKTRVDQFQSIVWELRRVVFAFCFSELILRTPIVSEAHLKHYRRLLKDLRAHFIVLER